MSKFENFAFFLTNAQIFSKMGKRKGDKEDPALLSRKKGYGKGLSNIIHVYRNEGKVVTQAEVHSQPESYSQESQPESHSQKPQPELNLKYFNLRHRNLKQQSHKYKRNNTH